MDKLKRIKLLSMDVDGVLTDGSIMFGLDGDVKVFNVLDGLGINVALQAGLEIAWITGNNSAAVDQRAATLGVKEVHQGARYKATVLREIAGRLGFAREEIAHVGDDLNDLPAFDVAGVKFAVLTAAEEVKAAADFVTEKPGGKGAVREVIETILKAQGRWDDAVLAFLERLREEQEKGEARGAVA